MTTTDSQTAQPPTKSYRAGCVEVAIWETQTQQAGRNVVQYSTKIQKRYQDKDGNWKTTDYFFPNDLPKLALAGQRAFEFITLNDSQAESEVPI